MFGYRRGDTPAVTAGKVAQRISAHDKWPFLTTLDLSTIHNETQLRSIVRDRAGLSKDQAASDVATWMEGYTAKIGAEPAPAAPSKVDRSLEQRFRHRVQ